ncbi:hypothetical protein F2Q69_00031793 [Brassica cretica]|uniref:Uncharacterized protein n=1 Tax=Brassica cretica TaxID=69181 RepID=A0A8S9RXH1_BRACR|nr:hypothetical protein F2Q69_00031793 [Brassica cretica]
MVAVQATIFHNWKQRNNVIHNQISLSPAAVFRFIDREVKNVLTAKKHLKLFQGSMSQC